MGTFATNEFSRSFRLVSVSSVLSIAARTERGLSVSIRVLVRSGTALIAEYPICCASNWATSEAVFTRCRRRCEMYRYENDATITVTKNVMVSTIFVFRRMRSDGLCVSGEPSTAGGSRYRSLLLPPRNRISRGTAVLFQFVVQSLQADAKNLCCPGFIIAGRFQGFEDQHLLGFSNRRPHAQADRIGIICGLPHGHLSEAG